MDEQTTARQQEPTIYEQLYLLLHAYRFGAISFLELLDAYEEALGIQPQASEKDDAA
jgi:hypothetical protein